jgi:branched-chain amino acid transport system ATP-binding protein
MLELKDVSVRYGAIQALDGISLRIGKEQLVAILGANGSGKTTLLKTISGLLEPHSGSILFEGRELSKRPPEEIVRLGIAHVPEGRGIFPGLTVRENLLAGAHTRRSRGEVREDYKKVLVMFPLLVPREKQLGGTLSGGEQQMLAIGRALMSRPRLLLADEVSLGLAPAITRHVYANLIRLKELGITLMVVEQNANMALKFADYVYVLKHGRRVLDGDRGELSSRHELTEAYLGV